MTAIVQQINKGDRGTISKVLAHLANTTLWQEREIVRDIKKKVNVWSFSQLAFFRFVRSIKRSQCSLEFLRTSAFEPVNTLRAQRLALGNVNAKLILYISGLNTTLAWNWWLFARIPHNNPTATTLRMNQMTPAASPETEFPALGGLVSKFLATIQLQPCDKRTRWLPPSRETESTALGGLLGETPLSHVEEIVPRNWMSCPWWAVIIRNFREGRCRQTQGWSLLIVLSTLVSP